MRFPVKAIRFSLVLTGFLLVRILAAQTLPQNPQYTVHVKFSHYADSAFVTEEWDVTFSEPGYPNVNYVTIKGNLAMDLPFVLPGAMNDALSPDTARKNMIRTYEDNYVMMCLGEIKGPIVTLYYDSAGRVTRYSGIPSLDPAYGYNYYGTAAPFDYRYSYSPSGKLMKAVCTKQTMTKSDFPVQIPSTETLRFQYDEQDRMTEARFIGADFSGWTMYFTYP